jgi:hypothetical protein
MTKGRDHYGSTFHERPNYIRARGAQLFFGRFPAMDFREAYKLIEWTMQELCHLKTGVPANKNSAIFQIPACPTQSLPSNPNAEPELALPHENVHSRHR